MGELKQHLGTTRGRLYSHLEKSNKNLSSWVDKQGLFKLPKQWASYPEDTYSSLQDILETISAYSESLLELTWRKILFCLSTLYFQFISQVSQIDTNAWPADLMTLMGRGVGSSWELLLNFAGTMNVCGRCEILLPLIYLIRSEIDKCKMNNLPGDKNDWICKWWKSLNP